MINIERLKGNLFGGLVAAFLALPMNIPLGSLALAPLGPNFLATGVAASLTASIVTGVITALAGGSRLQISGPRGSVSLIMAASITVALSHQATPEQAMAIGFLVVFLAGILQIIMGVGRAGQAIKYIPYPVLAGFMNGVAILIIFGQLSAAVGLPSTLRWNQIGSHISEIPLPAIGVTLASMATMKLSFLLTKRIPPIIMSFIVGISIDQALRIFLGNNLLGPLVGQLEAGIPTLSNFWLIMDLPWSTQMHDWLLAETPNIFVMALVASIESLLSVAAIDAETGDNHNSNRELIGQGLGNAIGAFFGGLVCTGSPNRGLSSYKAGGNSPWAAIFHSMILLALLLWGKPLLASMPYSVLAGTMIMVSLGLMDLSPFVLVYKYGRRYLSDCAIVLLVAGIAVLTNLAIAVTCGFIASSCIFILQMSKPVVRRQFDRTEVKSLRRRPLRDEKFLLNNGSDIVIIELEGPLFFGTTEGLRKTFIDSIKRHPSVVILDLSEISYLDLSGARVIRQCVNAQSKHNFILLIAGTYLQDPKFDLIMMPDANGKTPEINTLSSLDRAIECAENIQLSGCFENNDTEFPLAHVDMFSGIDNEEVHELINLLVSRVYESGETIFSLGDNGDGLYIIASGTVEIHYPSGSSTRFATFGPGTIFGEMALLDGKSRSASAVALEETSVYWLSIQKLKYFQNSHPLAATKLLLNIGREMSERLRLADYRLLGKSFHEFIGPEK